MPAGVRFRMLRDEKDTSEAVSHLLELCRHVAVASRERTVLEVPPSPGSPLAIVETSLPPLPLAVARQASALAQLALSVATPSGAFAASAPAELVARARLACGEAAIEVHRAGGPCALGFALSCLRAAATDEGAGCAVANAAVAAEAVAQQRLRAFVADRVKEQYAATFLTLGAAAPVNGVRRVGPQLLKLLGAPEDALPWQTVRAFGGAVRSTVPTPKLMSTDTALASAVAWPPDARANAIAIQAAWAPVPVSALEESMALSISRADNGDLFARVGAWNMRACRPEHGLPKCLGSKVALLAEVVRAEGWSAAVLQELPPCVGMQPQWESFLSEVSRIEVLRGWSFVALQVGQGEQPESAVLMYDTAVWVPPPSGLLFVADSADELFRREPAMWLLRRVASGSDGGAPHALAFICVHLKSSAPSVAQREAAQLGSAVADWAVAAAADAGFSRETLAVCFAGDFNLATSEAPNAGAWAPLLERGFQPALSAAETTNVYEFNAAGEDLGQVCVCVFLLASFFLLHCTDVAVVSLHRRVRCPPPPPPSPLSLARAGVRQCLGLELQRLACAACGPRGRHCKLGCAACRGAAARGAGHGRRRGAPARGAPNCPARCDRCSPRHAQGAPVSVFS